MASGLTRNQTANTENAEENGRFQNRAGFGAALSAEIDPDLARLIAAWPKLKKAARRFLADWPQLSAAKRKALVTMLAAMG